MEQLGRRAAYRVVRAGLAWFGLGACPFALVNVGLIVLWLLLVLATPVLFGLVFISLGLLVSAWTATRKQAIAIALSMWVVLVLVLLGHI